MSATPLNPAFLFVTLAYTLCLLKGGIHDFPSTTLALLAAQTRPQLFEAVRQANAAEASPLVPPALLDLYVVTAGAGDAEPASFLQLNQRRTTIFDFKDSRLEPPDKHNPGDDARDDDDDPDKYRYRHNSRLAAGCRAIKTAVEDSLLPLLYRPLIHYALSLVRFVRWLLTGWSFSAVKEYARELLPSKKRLPRMPAEGHSLGERLLNVLGTEVDASSPSRESVLILLLLVCEEREFLKVLTVAAAGALVLFELVPLAVDYCFQVSRRFRMLSALIGVLVFRTAFVLRSNNKFLLASVCSLGVPYAFAQRAALEWTNEMPPLFETLLLFAVEFSPYLTRQRSMDKQQAGGSFYLALFLAATVFTRRGLIAAHKFSVKEAPAFRGEPEMRTAESEYAENAVRASFAQERTTAWFNLAARPGELVLLRIEGDEEKDEDLFCLELRPPRDFSPVLSAGDFRHFLDLFSKVGRILVLTVWPYFLPQQLIWWTALVVFGGLCGLILNLSLEKDMAFLVRGVFLSTAAATVSRYETFATVIALVAVCHVEPRKSSSASSSAAAAAIALPLVWWLSGRALDDTPHGVAALLEARPSSSGIVASEAGEIFALVNYGLAAWGFVAIAVCSIAQSRKFWRLF